MCSFLCCVVATIKERKKCQERGDTEKVALLCNELGDAYMAKEWYTDAVEEFKTALHIMKAISDRKGLATVHRRISECYIELQDFDPASHHAQECVFFVLV